jgi:glycosyltransferase involved in cell wall biosynthesis
MSRSVLISTSEYPPLIGGVATASQRLARHLKAAGWRVHVVAALHDSLRREIESVDEDGVAVHRVRDAINTDPRGNFTLRRFVRCLDDQQNFDLFHGFFLTAAYPCLAVSERGGRRRPVIASIRGGDVHETMLNPYTRALILAVLRKATWITSISQLYIEWVSRDVDVKGRSSVIRNGVMRAAGEPWRLSDANRGVVGMVATFRRTKDIPLLIRSYARVAAELRRRLILVGFFKNRDEEEWSHELIDELGIRGQTEITGSVPRHAVPALMRGMHVYVHSATYEGMPNSVMEAATLGVPIVAADAGALGEILSDGENALVVPPGDPAALGGAVARVLADDALAAHLSAGALRLVGELTPERERDQWLALYDRLLSDDGCRLAEVRR